jgi:membrane fusion protein (multidrug efflux system)
MSETRAAHPADSPALDRREHREQPLPTEPSGERAPTRDDGRRRRRRWRRRIVVAVVGLGLLGVGLYFGIPWLENFLNVVSTDDAYVSGYVTYLGPRIGSRVDQVLVHEDDSIRSGEVLVRLDAEPFRVALEEAEAELQLAQAGLEQARTGVRSQLATARAGQFLTQSAVDQVHLQVATLHAAVDTLKLDEAKLVLAQKDFARVAKLTSLKVDTQEDYDQSRAALEVARNQVAAQAETVQQIRAGLGLSRNTEHPTEIPEDLEHRYAQIQVALSNWAMSLIQIGVPLNVVGLSSEALRAQLDQWLAGQMSAETLARLVENAPSVQVARAKVRAGQAAVDKARLDLSYTEIRAPFDGFVSRRSVNPGDYVSPGQNLLAVQSLTDVWVDANFKETQLVDLRIGMPVDVYVDAYPGKVFSAHVAGFSAATGSRLSLLPPENATGNFVKVVQRLPVRIEFEEPPPLDTPLFVGLSVEPQVHFKAPPRGAHAGQRLRLPQSGTSPAAPQPLSAGGEAAAGAAAAERGSAAPAQQEEFRDERDD